MTQSASWQDILQKDAPELFKLVSGARESVLTDGALSLKVKTLMTTSRRRRQHRQPGPGSRGDRGRDCRNGGCGLSLWRHAGPGHRRQRLQALSNFQRPWSPDFSALAGMDFEEQYLAR